MRSLAVVRSLLFALIFYPGTALYAASGLVAALTGAGPMRRVIRGWSDFHHVAVTYILGIRVVVEGAIPPGPFLIACKHQSMMETVEILRLARTPVVVMKRELADLPLWGRIARRYGIIPVEREAGAKALREMLVLGRQAIADGRPIAIFPEGTRVPVGSSPPLRAGFAGLYRALGLAVVPVAVDSGLVWDRGLVKRRGTITFRIGATIEPGLKRDAVEARVHAAINALETSPA